MAKKQKEEEAPAGSPAWMATFSDLMNLLLCFFILLFASSTIDAEKMRQISASFSKISIFDGGSFSLTHGQAVDAGLNMLTSMDNYVNSQGRNADGTSDNLSEVKEDEKKLVDSDQESQKMVNHTNESENSSASQDQSESQDDSQQNANSQQGSAASDSQSQQAQDAQSEQSLEQQMQETGQKQSEQMNEEIEAMLESSQISEDVGLDYNAQYVEISLNGGILFASGGVELTKDARRLVGRVGDILVKYRNQLIEIEGHTDNQPYSGEYHNNQMLSTARAISVYNYLIDKKNLIPANMKTSGFGDTRPKASNKTAKGRALNRRVVIKIYNNLNSNQ
jgi:chemotaxis protein MotB